MRSTPAGAQAGTAFVAIQGDFSPLGKQLRARGGLLHREGLKIGTLVGAGIGAGAVGAGKALYDIGARFDDASDTIRVQTGATGRRLKGLQNDFKQVVQDVPTDFESAGTAVAGLSQRLGLTGKPLREVSERVLELTRLTKGDIAQDVPAITRLFGDWSVKTGQQAGTLDKLFRASQATGVGVGDLSRLMVQFGSPLRQLGLDFDTTAAMFARFEKEGVNTQTVLPGLRFALKTFAKEGKDPAKALRETITEIKNAGSTAEANQLAFKVFGTRAGPDMAAAIREGRFDLDKLIGTIRHGKDTIRGASKDTEDFSEKWIKFRNHAMVKLEPVATRVFDRVSKEADAFFAILDDPKLTTDQKIDKVFDRIGDDVQEAIPVIAENAGKAGLAGAKAFARAFVDSGLLGQAVLTGLLAKKTGLAGALGKRLKDLVTGGGRGGGVADIAKGARGASPATPLWVAVVNDVPGEGIPGGKRKGPLGRVVDTVKKGAPALVAAGRTAASVPGAPVVAGAAAFGASQLGAAALLNKVFPGDSKLGSDARTRDFLKQTIKDAPNATAAVERLRAKVKQLRSEQEKVMRLGGDDRAAKDYDRQAAAINRLADKIDDARKRVNADFASMRASGGQNLSAIRKTVQRTTRDIASRLGTDTAQGKDALAKNFRLAAAAVRESMAEGKISTRTGLREIEALMRQALAQYGITGKEAGRYIAGQDTKTGKDISTARPGNYAAGAMIVGRPGERGRDDVPAILNGQPALVARGEMVGVFNRHQYPELDSMVREHGYRSLPDFMASKPKHYMSAGGLIEAAGGHVGGQGRADVAPHASGTGGGGTIPRHGGVAALLALGHELIREGYQVGENNAFGGVHPVHVNGSYHYRFGGRGALDVNHDQGNEDAALTDLARRLVAAGWHVLWHVPDHFDHLHVDVAGGGGSGIGAIGPIDVPTLKRVAFQKGLGAVSLIGQAGLDRVRAAAQDQLASAVGGPMETGGIGSMPEGPWRETLTRIARDKGWSAADWLWIIGHETGGRPVFNAQGSGAFGLGQLMPENYSRLGGGPGSSMTEQVVAMGRYIAERYGNPTTAKAYWQAHNSYAAGALLARAASGLLMAQNGIAGVHGVVKGKARLKGKPRRARIKPYKPHPFAQRLKDVTELAIFQTLTEKLAENETGYGNLEREQALTDEEPLRTAKVTDLTDEQLQALGVPADQIANFRADGPKEVEVRNEDDIARAAAEIDMKIRFKQRAANWLNQQQGLARQAIDRLKAGIAERLARVEAIKTRAAKNIKRIKELQHQAALLDAAERRAKGKKMKALVRRQNAPLRRQIARELDGLRDDNERLLGTRNIPDDLDTVDGGQLGPARATWKSWRTQLEEDFQPAAAELPQSIIDVGLDIKELLKERAGWTDTKPPTVDIPEPDKTLAETKDTSDEIAQRRADLLQEELRDANLRAAVSEAHFRVFDQVFRGLPAFGGGGIVPGATGAPQPILAHGREGVFTPEQMAAMGGGTNVPISVIVHGDIVSDRPDPVEVLIGDQRFAAAVERVTRGQARLARRPLPGRPGVLR